MPWWVLFISDWVSAGSVLVIAVFLILWRAGWLHPIAIEHQAPGGYYTEYALGWGRRPEVLGKVEERMEAERDG